MVEGITDRFLCFRRTNINWIGRVRQDNHSVTSEHMQDTKIKSKQLDASSSTEMASFSLHRHYLKAYDRLLYKHNTDIDRQ